MLDKLLTGIVLIASFYLLFVIGKLVHSLLHREYDLTHELVEKDNPAVALALTGYYFGLVLAIGGALVGPSNGIYEDIIDLFIYGLLSIILLNISWFLCDKLILHSFKISDELIRDQNQGTGAVSFGMSVATGLLIYGSVSGEGGNIFTATAFWGIGQIVLIVAAIVYSRLTPYDVHDQIEKDNVAAGVSFAGVLIATGLVVGPAAQSDFVSWKEDIVGYLLVVLAGLVLLPLIRFLTDKILLPRVSLADEIANQETPNAGAAYIEAFSYIAASFAIYWCV